MKKLMMIVVPVVFSAVMIMLFMPFIQTSDEGYNGVKLAAKNTELASVDDVNISEDEAASDAEEKATDIVDEVTQAGVETTQTVVDTASATSETVMDAVEDKAKQVEAIVAPAPAPAPAATAEVHVIKPEGLKFAPLVIEIAVGDTVAWENMSSHDTQSIEGLVPEGAELWHSSMGENFEFTFTKEGIYIYKCTPHFGAGMGGVIIVGKPVNLAAMKEVEVKGAAKRLVKKAIKAAEAI
jgi:pseudoazurin